VLRIRQWRDVPPFHPLLRGSLAHHQNESSRRVMPGMPGSFSGVGKPRRRVPWIFAQRGGCEWAALFFSPVRQDLASLRGAWSAFISRSAASFLSMRSAGVNLRFSSIRDKSRPKEAALSHAVKPSSVRQKRSSSGGNASLGSLSSDRRSGERWCRVDERLSERSGRPRASREGRQARRAECAFLLGL